MTLALGSLFSAYPTDYSFKVVNQGAWMDWGYVLGEFTAWEHPVPMFKHPTEKDTYILKLKADDDTKKYKPTNSYNWLGGWWGEGGKEITSASSALTGTTLTFYAKNTQGNHDKGSDAIRGDKMLMVTAPEGITNLYIKAPFTDNQVMALTKTETAFTFTYKPFDYTGIVPDGYLDFHIYKAANGTEEIAEGVQTLNTTQDNQLAVTFPTTMLVELATVPENTPEHVYIKGEVTNDVFIEMTKGEDLIWRVKVTKGGAFNFYGGPAEGVIEEAAVRTLDFVIGDTLKGNEVTAWNNPVMTLQVTVPALTSLVYVNGNFNGWNETTGFMPMTYLGFDTYSYPVHQLQVAYPDNKLFYKFYHDKAWDKVENDALGESMQNQSAHVVDFTADFVQENVVPSWANYSLVGLDKENMQQSVVAIENQIVVSLNNHADIRIISMTGVVVDQVSGATQFLSRKLNSGIYLVQIDNEIIKIALK